MSITIHKRARKAAAIAEGVADLPVDLVFPNPDQPRKTFKPGQMEELIGSIRERGLIQRIKVTPRDGRFMIVAGERRWRAHVAAGIATIPADVKDMTDAEVALQAIVENEIRADVPVLEQAAAYQRELDRGMTVEELAKAIGLKQPWRITERTCLLKLRPEYQQLLSGGGLTSSQAYELAQLSPAGQDQLFQAIRLGECRTYDQLRQRALLAREQDQVVELFAWGADERPAESTKRAARSFESRVQRIVTMLQASTIDNEVVAVRKVNAERAEHLADLFAAMRGDCERIEAALRAKAATLV